MKHISEEHIEKFVRFPETLSSSEKAIITKELTVNPELRALALWFADFYDELDSLEATRFSDGIIELKPIKKQDQQSRSSFRILAAMTPDSVSARLETVATLASEEYGTVARVLKNRAEKAYKLHLIRQEQPVETERTIFTIEPLDLDLVINESRHLTFDSTPMLEKLNWKDARILLREAQLKTSLKAEDMASGNITSTVSNDELEISIRYDIEINALIIHQVLYEGAHQPVSRVLLSSDNSQDTLYRMNIDGETIIPIDTFEDQKLQFFM